MPTDIALLFLPEVRISFPALFTPEAMEEGKELQFSTDFIFDNTQHAALLDKIDATIDRIALDEWRKVVKFKRCLRDGNDRSDTDGYGDGKSFITARNKVRVPIVGRDGATPIVEADGLIYGGCYVNAEIRLFAWSHPTGGKGVSAGLRCVQFVKHGDPFGGGSVADPTKVFKPLDSDDSTGAPTGAVTRSRSRSGTGAPPSSNLDDY